MVHEGNNSFCPTNIDTEIHGFIIAQRARGGPLAKNANVWYNMLKFRVLLELRWITAKNIGVGLGAQ